MPLWRGFGFSGFRRRMRAPLGRSNSATSHRYDARSLRCLGSPQAPLERSTVLIKGKTPGDIVLVEAQANLFAISTPLRAQNEAIAL